MPFETFLYWMIVLYQGNEERQAWIWHKPFLYPGPSHAKRLKAFLKPFIEESKKLGPTSSGFKVEDFSLDPADPDRTFDCKILVLNVLGDYPGIAQLLSSSDHKACSGCIKCNFWSTFWHINDTDFPWLSIPSYQARLKPTLSIEKWYMT